MRRDEIVKFWGSDNLNRWPKTSLDCLVIPEASKSFLAEVGLPSGADWTFRFGPDDDEPRKLLNHEQYHRLGFDGAVPICLDDAHVGRVVAIERKASGGARYVNASVECFGEFLVYYQQYRMLARHSSEDDAMQIIDLTEERMRRSDSIAFGNANNFWPVILEQMNQGLL